MVVTVIDAFRLWHVMDNLKFSLEVYGCNHYKCHQIIMAGIKNNSWPLPYHDIIYEIGITIKNLLLFKELNMKKIDHYFNHHSILDIELMGDWS